MKIGNIINLGKTMDCEDLTNALSARNTTLLLNLAQTKYIPTYYFPFYDTEKDEMIRVNLQELLKLFHLDWALQLLEETSYL